MAEQTVYCEECVEDIPSSEVYWDEGRLYCHRCGSEVEAPDRDIFEEIEDNRTGFLFRDQDLNADPDEDDEDEEDEEEDEADAADEEVVEPREKKEPEEEEDD